jgi:hypothetical protein
MKRFLLIALSCLTLTATAKAEEHPSLYPFYPAGPCSTIQARYFECLNFCEDVYEWNSAINGGRDPDRIDAEAARCAQDCGTVRASEVRRCTDRVRPRLQKSVSQEY